VRRYRAKLPRLAQSLFRLRTLARVDVIYLRASKTIRCNYPFRTGQHIRLLYPHHKPMRHYHQQLVWHSNRHPAGASSKMHRFLAVDVLELVDPF
jgi:hypothetical protein